MNWLERVIKTTEKLEPPERFWWWASLAALSAVTRRKVYLDRHSYKLYPNIYVMLLGKSGLRKGVPVDWARKWVEKTRVTRLIAGRGSVQGIVKSLGTAYTIEGVGLIKDAHGMLVGGEMASFLVQDPVALTVLTDLYDSHYNPTWESILKHSDTDHLENIYLTLLGASNEIHLKDVIQQRDIEGGFIARTFLIQENKKRCSNDLIDAPVGIGALNTLHEYLAEVARAFGEFSWTSQSKLLYKSWYAEMEAKKHSDTTGTVDRVTDQVLKVAMLISLGESIDLVMKEDHLLEAIQRCIVCYGAVQRMTMGSGKSQMAEQTAIILKDLLGRPTHEIQRSKLLQKYWGHFDAFDLDRIVENLLQMKAITQRRNGNDWVYRLTEKTVLAYTQINDVE